MASTKGRRFCAFLLSQLGTRKPLDPERHRAFVYRNRQRLEDALETTPCSTCGYVGPALSLIPPKGEQGPASLVYSSEAAFERALQRSTPTCCNCAQVELSKKPFNPTKRPRASVAPFRTLETLKQLGSVSGQPLQVVVPERIRDHEILFSETQRLIGAVALQCPDLESKSPSSNNAQ